MRAAISSVDAPPDPAELASIVREYLLGLAPHVGPGFDPDAMATATLGNLPAYLPPRGRLLLARGPDDALLGTCFLKLIRPNAAEIKRLFLRPAARGQGLGRSLALRAVAEARDLGATRVLLDTGHWMTEAQALYRRMGFREVGRYPESENPPSVHHLLVYMELDLARPGVSSA
jgi:GNAT superfamily N-acetyltransferase